MDTSIVWPLASNVIRARLINHTFGMVRKYESGAPRPHQGWDFEARVGEPVFSIADGKVIFVRDKGDYGLQLCTSFSLNGQTYYAFYAHLNKVYVNEGDTIEKNAFIAASGKSGNAMSLPASEEHVHFEIRTREMPRLGLQDRVSPVAIFGKCPLSIPIPG
jgi:peptidoglycan LD-endopeptidase LytH